MAPNKISSAANFENRVFDIGAIPPGAWVVDAELVLFQVDRGLYDPPLELDVSAVDYGSTLDPSDLDRPRYDTTTFGLGTAPPGYAIGFDLTELVRYEIDHGATRLGLRLDAFGGDLLFEDGGSHLGTGAVPLLTVVYEW